jgi:putative restriction endonuclease
VAGATDTHDAHKLLADLIGRPLLTISGRPNEIVELRAQEVVVATGRTPAGTSLPVAWVQEALDSLQAVGELRIDTPTVGYRSAFIGAVLQTLPGARVEQDPQRIVLEGDPPDDPRSLELARREQLWSALSGIDGTAIAAPGELRERGIYRGAGGIWVDKVTTSSVSPNGKGVAVAILHTGRHYPDDLSDDGMLYHYPRTNRPAGRDRAEIEALKNAGRLRLPLFVITEADGGRKRLLRLGWVEDWDDESQQALVSFEPTDLRSLPREEDDPFELREAHGGRRISVKARRYQQRFKLDVLKRYGTHCAMCSVAVPQLIKAAHLLPYSKGGTNDPRNGLPLCANHHDALDRGLVKIHPLTLALAVTSSYTHQQLGITQRDLCALRAKPHREALQALWDRGTFGA